MGSAESDKKLNEDNVWSSILSEVRSNASVKLPSGKAVVVLGHPESGKTTLVAKLQGIEDPKKGSGLEYTYIEIRDEYREDTTHLSVFTLDGDKSHGHLLQFALNEATLSDTTVILTASMATPWLLLEQLSEWASLLHDHVDSLKVPPDSWKRLRDGVVSRWCSYVEPGEDNEAAAAGTKSEDENIKDCVLGDGVLVRNVGLDVVVVITKTDHMTALERDEGYKEEHFDFIQYNIRKFCASYGASLFYTSVKEDKNCDLLYKYLVHRVYNNSGGGVVGGGFRTPALVVEKDAVFIPSGWDNVKKMQILLESMTSIHPDKDFYNDVIQRPITTKQMRAPTTTTTEVEVEEEQRFLERQVQILNVGGSGGASNKAIIKTPGSAGSGGENKARVTPSSASGGGTPKKGEQCTDRVLANFFNSLLTSKKSGGGGGSGPSSANTSLSGTDC